MTYKVTLSHVCKKLLSYWMTSACSILIFIGSDSIHKEVMTDDLQANDNHLYGKRIWYIHHIIFPFASCWLFMQACACNIFYLPHNMLSNKLGRKWWFQWQYARDYLHRSDGNSVPTFPVRSITPFPFFLLPFLEVDYEL